MWHITWKSSSRDLQRKSGFVKGYVFADARNEDKIKEKLAVTSRCMPLNKERSQIPAYVVENLRKKMVYWGRAY